MSKQASKQSERVYVSSRGLELVLGKGREGKRDREHFS